MPPEECDRGSLNSATAYGAGQCTDKCRRAPYCGDGMINGMDLNDLEYGPLGQFSDGFEETEPNADPLEGPGNMIYLQIKGEPLTQRLEQLKQRIAVFAAAQADHDTIAFGNHAEIANRFAHPAQQNFAESLILADQALLPLYSFKVEAKA